MDSIEEQTLIQQLQRVKYRAFNSITDCALAGRTSKIALVFNLMLTTLHILLLARLHDVARGRNRKIITKGSGLPKVPPSKL